MNAEVGETDQRHVGHLPNVTLIAVDGFQKSEARVALEINEEGAHLIAEHVIPKFHRA